MTPLTDPKLADNLIRLLDAITERTSCKGCGRTIWFVRLKSGKLAPYTVDGINHFADCPAAAQFKRKRDDAQKG